MKGPAMIGIGISLSIGNPILNAVRTKTPADYLREAILLRHRVVAKHDGKSLVMEPYALFRANGITMLHAVVIYSEAKRIRKFKPQDFDSSTMVDVTVTEDTFFPNWAFNAESLSPEIIVAVELVEYGQNGEQANPSAVQG
jgi:hypothetical protein